jgi:hypothetical protein
MKASRLRDNAVVTVERHNKNIWQDIDTQETYVLHVDIELIY